MKTGGLMDDEKMLVVKPRAGLDGQLLPELGR